MQIKLFVKIVTFLLFAIFLIVTCDDSVILYICQKADEEHILRKPDASSFRLYGVYFAFKISKGFKSSSFCFSEEQLLKFP